MDNVQSQVQQSNNGFQQGDMQQHNHSNGQPQKNGLAIAGLVLGIIGVCLFWIPIINWLAILLGLLALIFGIVALIMKSNKALSITSLILGLVAVIASIFVKTIWTSAVIGAGNAASDALNDAADTWNEATDNLSGNNTEQILSKYLDVTMGEFTVTDLSYGLVDTELAVTVKNKSDSQKSFTIQLEAIDSDGNRLETDTIYINDLNAGQSQNEKAFEWVSKDNLEALKTATFKVNSVSMY